MPGNIKIANKFVFSLLPNNLRTLKTSVKRQEQNQTKQNRNIGSSKNLINFPSVLTCVVRKEDLKLHFAVYI